MHPESWPIERIKPYPKNPRTHPPEQIALLAKLIGWHGPDQPIVVDENGVILKGHGRLAAAQLAGLKTFPVVMHRGLAESDKMAMRVADNQVALLSGWDRELLMESVRDLSVVEFPLALLGFDDREMASLKMEPTPLGDVTLDGYKFAVIVECESEEQQRQRLEDFAKQGFSCRALIS